MTSDEQVDQSLWRAAKEQAPMNDERAAALWGAIVERRRQRSMRRGRATTFLAAAVCLFVGFGAGRWTRTGLVEPPMTETTAVMSLGDHPDLLRLVREGLPLIREVGRNPEEARLAGVAELLWLTRRLRDATPRDDPAVELLLSDIEMILVQLLEAGRDTATVARTLAGDAIIARAIVPRMEQLDVSPGVQ